MTDAAQHKTVFVCPYCDYESTGTDPWTGRDADGRTVYECPRCGESDGNAGTGI